MSRCICDLLMHYTGGNCFGLFPPSFYYIHTEEEVRCITDETLERLRSMIKELEDERTPQEKDLNAL